MKAIHSRLRTTIDWYDSWHDHPRHQHVHWLGLFLFTFAVSLLISIQFVSLYIENGGQAHAQTALPNANHPMSLGYYYDIGQYGNFISETNGFTDSNIILAGSWIRGAPDCMRDTAGLESAFQSAIAAGNDIIYAPIGPVGSTCPDGQSEYDVAVSVASNYWNNIDSLYLADEPNWDKTQTENYITTFENALSASGLSSKPSIINYTRNQIMTGASYLANNLDIVSFEAYVDPSRQNEPNIASTLVSEVTQAKNQIGNRQMIVVIQGYNRNGTWTNLNSLQAIQTSAYLATYNDSNVRGLTIFSYGRAGGTRDLGDCIKTEHRKIWEAITGGTQPASVPCSGSGGGTPIQYAPILSTWTPPQTANGWWAKLSYDAKYVSYGNFGESWVTDLETGQNWDFRNPPGLPSDGRCIAAYWIDPDTGTMRCESGPNQYYRYEFGIGQWTPVRTSDDPNLVNGNWFNAVDGHWGSLAAVTRLVKDNQILTQNQPGSAATNLDLAMGGEFLAHACDNSNQEICVWEGNQIRSHYTPQIPYYATTMADNYLVYGEIYGRQRGICLEDGQDINLVATSWGGESLSPPVMVNGQPWVVSGTSNPANGEGLVLLRPWGQRRSIVVRFPVEPIGISTRHANGIFTIAGHDATGRMYVLKVPDNSPRNDLSGGLADETCESAAPPPPEIGPALCPAGTPPNIINICDFAPSIVMPGGNVEISGVRLAATVQLYDTAGRVTDITGIVNTERTLVSFFVPTNTPLGDYTIGVIDGSSRATSTETLSVVASLPAEGEAEAEPFAAPTGTLPNPTAPPFESLIKTIYNYSLIVVGIAVFIMILWGGFLWMTSAANPGNIATAKRYIYNAIIGAILLISSYVILYTINPELVGGTFRLPGLSGSTGAQSIIIQPTCDTGFCSNNPSLACTQDPDCNVVCIGGVCNNGVIGACTLDTDCQIVARYITTSESQAATAFSSGCAGVITAGFQDLKTVECPETMGLAQDFVVEAQDLISDQQIGATAVHSAGNQGAGRKIVVLDTGYNRNHPQLSSSYIGGWDFVNRDNDPDDDHATGTGSPGHGSHVAGIITSDGTDGQSVGVAPQAQIIAGKVLDSRGRGYFSNIISAIYWAINGPDNIYGTADDYHPDAINISIGSGAFPNFCDTTDSTTQEMTRAINYARDHGALVVVAAGNNASGVAMPGCINNAFTVGAVNSSDVIAGFSGRGAGLDVTAPGVNIYSSLLGSNFGNKSGTSMASPMVAGLVALIKSAFPSYNVGQVEQAIINTAVDLGPSGKDLSYGWGRISATAAGSGSAACTGTCGTLVASPPSCTKGTITSNPNCNINISYTSTGIAPSQMIIKKNGSDWQTPSAASGSVTESNPSPGVYNYRLQDRSTGTLLASITVNIFYGGSLDSPWLSCIKGTATNPNCDITLSYNIVGGSAGNASIFKDGSSWKTVALPSGSTTDLNPAIGTHTYTLRDTTGSTQVQRVVIRIEGVPRPRTISSLSSVTARVGETITITGINLGNELEIARRYFTVQLHNKSRTRHTTTGDLDPSNTFGTWVVDIDPSMYSQLPVNVTLRVGPTLNLNDVSNEVNLTIIP